MRTTLLFEVDQVESSKTETTIKGYATSEDGKKRYQLLSLDPVAIAPGTVLRVTIDQDGAQ